MNAGKSSLSTSTCWSSTLSVKSSAQRAQGKSSKRRSTAETYATYLTSKGYKRIYSGPDRGKYEHRVVMRELCKVWCYYPVDEGTGLPVGLDVHHVDFDKEHNCAGNLILLDTAIHVAISGWWYRIKQTGRYEDKPAPLDWEVGWYEERKCETCGRVKMVLMDLESRAVAEDEPPEWVWKADHV